jgi:hypothetical protein
MAFETLNDLLAGMAGNACRLPYSRASIGGGVSGMETSLWRGTGFPQQGAIPGAAAICSSALEGALPLAPRSGGQERIIAQAALQGAVTGHTLMIEDRLGHMGGLSGTSTSAQTVGLDLHANLATSNLAARIGASNSSEVEWYLEWYTATGGTVTTPTAQVTFHDGSTGSVNIWGAGGVTTLPATVAASRRYKLVATNGKFIRSVETVTLSVSTGTVGSFGVTAVVNKALFEVTVANALQVRDWSVLAAPRIADDACITFGQMLIGTTTGASAGSVVQAVA